MSDESAKEWLNTNWPNMHACDVNWTMKRYDYPDHVCEYIKNNWIKISDSGGGTYQQKYDYKKCLDRTHILWRTEAQNQMQKELDEEENKPQTVPEIIHNKIKEDPSGKAAAKLYQCYGQRRDGCCSKTYVYRPRIRKTIELCRNEKSIWLI